MVYESYLPRGTKDRVSSSKTVRTGKSRTSADADLCHSGVCIWMPNVHFSETFRKIFMEQATGLADALAGRFTGFSE